jgi:alkanesulfonate monooxygenase SsuD/methylene tetrahydromethanopterin reductase-like flavin-dependent oxidoreductase (luciferase family)
MEFETKSAGSPALAFEQGFRLVDLAEAWGPDCAWLGEMHFSPARSVLSAPVAVASAVATLTREVMPAFK